MPPNRSNRRGSSAWLVGRGACIRAIADPVRLRSPGKAWHGKTLAVLVRVGAKGFSNRLLVAEFALLCDISRAGAAPAATTQADRLTRPDESSVRSRKRPTPQAP